MPDLTPEGLRARARTVVAVEPDGKSWRVVLVCGTQRSTVIGLSEREACEAYATWIQDKILLPTFTVLVAEARRAQREADAIFVEEHCHFWDDDLCQSVRIAAAIRAQEETP